jgi:urease accessory protein UreE
VLIYLGFVVGNSHLPSGIRETLCKEKFSLAELQNLLNYLRHICECTERKMKQFIEAEKEQGNAHKGHRINVSFRNLNYKL